MYNEVITLVAEEKQPDEYGDLQITESTRDIFATLKSISQSEFYQAQAAGLKPEVKFVIADYLDYEDEKVIRYTPYGASTPEEYRVLRTYRDGNTLEIVCKRGVDE